MTPEGTERSPRPREHTLRAHNQHACLFYQSEEERQAGVVPFFEQAIEARAKILYASKDEDNRALIEGLLGVDIDLRALQDIGQLEFLTTRALFSQEGSEDHNHAPYLTGPVVQRVREAARLAIEQGFLSLYLSLEIPSGEPSIIDLEAEFNRRSPSQTGSLSLPLVVLCQFDRQRLPDKELLDGLMCHPFVLTAQGAFSNSLYVPPPVDPRESIVKKRFDDWLDQVVERQEMQDRLDYSERMYRTIIQASPDAIVLIGRSGNIGFASERALELFDYASFEEIRGTFIFDHLIPEDKDRARERFAAVVAGAPSPGDHFTMRRRNGELFTGEVFTRTIINKHGQVEGVVAVVRDITAKLQMQADLMASEERHRTISEMVSDYALGMRVTPSGTVEIAWSTDSFKAITGHDPGQVSANGGLSAIAHPEDALFLERQRQRLLSGQPVVSEFRIVRPDGEIRWIYQLGRPFSNPVNGHVTHYYLVGQDITARKQAEADLEESEQTARALLDTSPSTSVLFDPQGTVLACNEALARYFERPISDLIGKKLQDLLSPEDLPIYLSRLEHVVATGESLRVIDDSGEKTFDMLIYPVCDHEGRVRRVAVSVTDVSVYRQAEKKERQQRLFAETLRATSEALAQALDKDAVLDTVVGNLLVLEPEAAVNIMLVEPDGKVRSARYYDPRFPDQPLRTSERLSDPILFEFSANRNLRVMSETLAPLIVDDTLAFEGWVDHPSNHWVRSSAATPIVANQRAIGFLCLESDRPNFFTESHAELLRHFASQAAISLQKAQIFAELQQSHTELQEAYDATIQGLAKALEMRDKETEGHSRRVVHLTQRLGERLGMWGQDLNALRWGALLHDIGKMGVPDSILLKPSPLSEEEWVTMRQHPRFAYDIIKDIPYLNRSSEIPLYHHERYDGTGYPQRLKGDAIPLPARIFAAVDALDALLSRRPYRPAWPVDEVLQHLKGESGRQFDPRIVIELLRMIDEEPDLMQEMYGLRRKD